MVLDRVFDRSGLPPSAERERERPYVLDLMVPERSGGGIVGPGGERIRSIIQELGCEVQVSREPLAGIAAQKRVKLIARERGRGFVGACLTSDESPPDAPRSRGWRRRQITHVYEPIFKPTSERFDCKKPPARVYKQLLDVIHRLNKNGGTVLKGLQKQ